MQKRYEFAIFVSANYVLLLLLYPLNSSVGVSSRLFVSSFVVHSFVVHSFVVHSFVVRSFVVRRGADRWMDGLSRTRMDSRLLCSRVLRGTDFELELKLAPVFLFAACNWQESRIVVGCCVLRCLLRGTDFCT